jgi:hypothetical protein
MMKKEFEKLSRTQIDNRVYDRIEDDYMNADGYNREQWFKKFGKNGIIRCYSAELNDKNMKLDSLARKAIEAYQRCHSSELLDENDRVKHRDLWNRLMARYGMACAVLEIDEYAEDAMQKLWSYVIV